MGYKHNKEEILKVGYEVFRTNGYHNVGINQILKESGIPKGSFYNYFESKEDFAQQVIQQYGENNKLWMEDFFENCDLSPIECLKSFYTFMMNLNENDKYNGGCLVNNMSVEVGHRNEVIGTEANLHFMGWLNVLAMEITKGQNMGEITRNFSALELAEYIHAGFYGVLARTKVAKNRVYMDIWFEMTFKFIST